MIAPVVQLANRAQESPQYKRTQSALAMQIQPPRLRTAIIRRGLTARSPNPQSLGNCRSQDTRIRYSSRLSASPGPSNTLLLATAWNLPYRLRAPCATR